MAEPVKLMWKPPCGKETQIDRLREKVNVKYGLDLGEPYTTDPKSFGADGLHNHPCTRSTFSAVRTSLSTAAYGWLVYQFAGRLVLAPIKILD